MGRIRARLTRIAAGWVVIHLALLISVPTTICSMNAGISVGAACTCDFVLRDQQQERMGELLHMREEYWSFP